MDRSKALYDISQTFIREFKHTPRSAWSCRCAN